MISEAIKTPNLRWLKRKVENGSLCYRYDIVLQQACEVYSVGEGEANAIVWQDVPIVEEEE